jgi:hypothetical protein
MFRFVLCAVALAGVLATAQPVFADPLTTTAADHAQIGPPATEQPAPPALAARSSSDAPAPVSPRLGKQAPVGFGWG